MEDLLPFLQKYEGWIYVLLAVVALIYLQKLFLAWKDCQGTVFGLERENANRRLTTSLTILVLLVLFVIAEFVLVSFVAPAYPQIAALPTGTLDVLATPTVTLAPRVEGVTALTTDAAATPTFEPLEEGCIPGQIEWIEPGAGATISDTVKLVGTVNVPNLGFYKYEYAEKSGEVWSTIAADNMGKVNGEIGFWNTSQLESGDYQLRLVVVDNQNQAFPACIIAVRIARP
jgi:hypothetical protein